ncbi:MAG: SDR family NAD(P)-dependent oxidoreductase [Thermoplasmata archaeon]
MRLKDKVALVTGGTEGMGFATAALFLREGARVTISGRSEEKGRKAVSELSKIGDAHFVRGDVASAADALRMVEETVDRFGRIDVLFNNAGVYIEKSAEEMSEEEWDRLMDVNVKGTFLVSKYAIPHMRRQGGGVIVNNSSDAGIIGNRNCPAYCASKGAVTLMTKAMALDYAGCGIRVNSVNPGTIDTPMLAREVEASEDPGEYMARTVAESPMGRIGRADEVAKAVLFLASDESSFVTGACLSVDGGSTAQ